MHCICICVWFYMCIFMFLQVPSLRDNDSSGGSVCVCCGLWMRFLTSLFNVTEETCL